MRVPRLRGILATVVVAGVVGAGSLTWIAVAEAAPAPGFGYVWANDPTAEVGRPYVPDQSYQRNSSQAQNTITHTGTGAYTVFFPNLSASGTPAVTAYNGTDERCKVATWKSGTSGGVSGTLLNVRCHTRTGAPADTMFTATYTQALFWTATTGAYLWSNKFSEPLDVPYTPNTRYQFNSAGGPATVTRLDTGYYQVRIPGLVVPSTTLVVTATGTTGLDPSLYCSDGGTWPLTDHTVAYIDCTNAAGGPADSAFALSIVTSGNTMFSRSVRAAYGGATCYGDEANPPSSARTCFGTPTDYLGHGSYAMHLPIDMSNGNVQITLQHADGLNPRSGRCKINSWGSDTVYVHCYDVDGAPANHVTSFRVSFVV